MSERDVSGADIAAALREVAGVSAADLESGADGGVGVLHLGLEPGADEAAVAAEVAGVLRERFGLGIDAEQVRLIEDSVAEAVAGAPAAPPAPQPAREPAPVALDGARRRAVIKRMQVVSTDLEVTATVTLAFGEHTAVGEGRATATGAGAQRAVAEATLAALTHLAGRRVRFDVDTVELSSAGAQQTVLVCVTMLNGHGSERLTGSAAVREDVRHACIRATLDAVNRRVEPLLAP